MGNILRYITDSCMISEDIQLDNSQIIMYQTEDGLTKIEVTLENETVWLSQNQMAELFQRDKSTISRHIKNIFEERELDKIQLLQKLQQLLQMKNIRCRVNSEETRCRTI